MEVILCCKKKTKFESSLVQKRLYNDLNKAILTTKEIANAFFVLKLPDAPSDKSDYFYPQLGRWLESDKFRNAFEIGYFDDLRPPWT